MSAVDDILAQIPVEQLAAQLGVDPPTAERAARSALPALLGGMGANAQDPGGAASLAEAVRQHDPSLVEGGVDLGQVDTVDGDKIVSHVFGGNRDQVVHQLGGLGGSGGGGLMAKLLPLLAPIVLSYLARQVAGRAGGAPSADRETGLEEVLGDLLGGGRGGAQGDVLGDVLGGLLGGGRR